MKRSAASSDVAPTILHSAGRQTPAGWQGRSLLAPNRPNRTYYFAPFSDLLFGCRDGNLSYIFNASDGSHELYYLSIDPEQRRNLAQTRREDVRSLHERVAAWVQYQHGLVRPPVRSQRGSSPQLRLNQLS